MTLNELYFFIKNLLQGSAQTDNPALLARRITTLISGYSTTDIAAHPDAIVNNATREDVEQIINRVKNNEPLEYIFNNASFLDLELYTNSSVLVPRPETEELAMMISNNLNNQSNKKILDIGTGSGCIPIYLALHNTDNQYFACDISDNAIATAKQNAQKYNLNNIEIFSADIFNYQSNSILNNAVFDIIVSNPPYVADSEKALMQPNVLDYEPHTALFVPDNDPLIYYKKISEYAAAHLSPAGKLYFEINERFGKETAETMQQFGFKDVSIHQDLFGKDRMAEGTKA